MEAQRDKALNNQQIEFQEEKIKQLQSQLETSTKAYEERIKYEREEMQNDFKERLGNIQKDKEHLEEKYDRKRRDFKELEAQAIKEKNTIERDYAVEQEKLKNQIYKSEQEAKSALEELGKVRDENDKFRLSQ